jgi:hypothetical protein
MLQFLTSVASQAEGLNVHSNLDNPIHCVADGASGLLKCKDWEETSFETHQNSIPETFQISLQKFHSMVLTIESNKLSISSSETSGFFRTARHCNPEDQLIPSRTSPHHQKLT